MLEIIRRRVNGRWRTDVLEENGGSQALQRAYLRLSAADIQAASFTPYTIVAGAPNIMLNAVTGIARYVGGTPAYDGGGESDTDVGIYIGDPFSDNSEVLSSKAQDCWADVVPVTLPLNQNGDPQANVADLAGLPLNVALIQGGPLATGVSPLDVWVWYVAHDITDLT